MKRYIKTCLCLFLIPLLLISQTLPALHLYAEADTGLMRGEFRYAGMYESSGDAVLDYAYSDDYFSGDAREYNPSLSTMSLCLEMSSWSSMDEENWSDKTVNARNLLTGVGFSDFAQNDFWSDAPTVQSIGAVAARKQLEDSTLIALAVRGGGYFSEWGSNVLIGATDEHTGFATARDNVLSFLQNYIDALGITGRVKLWLVGFSRGGAVANMTAGYLNQHGLTGAATLAPADLYCYTFEAPQGIQQDAAAPDADYGNIHNIINPNDIVPLVAPDNWGFGRYNETSRLLPSITTVHYAEAYEEMLKQYETILEGVDLINPEAAVYGISEYAKTLQMQINCLAFLPGGSPFIEFQVLDNTHLPQSVMLTESVNALVDAAKSREGFHDNIEADVSTLLSELLSADKGASLSDYIQELGALLTENNYANLIYILEPVVQLNLSSMEKRISDVSARLREVIPQPEGYEDIFGTIASLTDLIATLIADNPQALLNLVLSLSSTNLIQAHNAEVTMAWLRIADPNFCEQPIQIEVPETVRIARINCPVDVQVFDAENRLIASIIGGEAFSSVNGVGCSVSPDGEMTLYLPADADFRIEINATAGGTVSYSINEFNVARNDYTFVANFPPVPVIAGNSLTALLPALDKTEFTDEPGTGSNAVYTLLDASGTAVLPVVILRGGDVETFTVRIERDSPFGQVLGGGEYISGSFARLQAYPVAGSSFVGWYAGDQLISSDPSYRFAVTGDLTLTARFTETALYQVGFTASEGGSVLNADGSYPAGTALTLAASADKNYEFSGWSASAGTIQMMDDGSAQFIVPEEDAVVTASFTPKGEICPHCHQVLPEGIHHRAPCGLNHYSCEWKYRESEHRYCPLCGDGYYCMPGHGFGSGECGVYFCEGCQDEIRITESHAAPCGVEGHFTCSDGYDESAHAACAHCGAYLCEGGDHSLCSLCGEGYICEGGHGTEKGQCSYVETQTCPGCGRSIPLTESHRSHCGHYTCAPGYVASEHRYHRECGGCLCNGANHSFCTLCRSGFICEGGHGTEKGQCSYVEAELCPGCGEPLQSDETHLAECGHYFCEEGFDESGHMICEICGDGFACQPGHGYEYGECGNPDTSAPDNTTEPDTTTGSTDSTTTEPDNTTEPDTTTGSTDSTTTEPDTTTGSTDSTTTEPDTTDEPISGAS